MVTITLYAREQKRHRCIVQSFGLFGRGRGWDDLGEWHWNLYNIVRCMILDAWGWCTGMTQRDGMGRDVGEGFRMGNTCIPVVDSCWCMAKPIQYCKVISSVQFSSVQSLSRDWLFATPWIARPPCPSPTPGVHSNARPSSQWCHPAISSSVVAFFSCPQSLPASEYFPMSQLFSWGGQSTGVSALASFLPKNTGLISFRMDWLDLLAVQGTLKSLLQHHSSKASILRRSAFFIVQISHPYMTIGKP